MLALTRRSRGSAGPRGGRFASGASEAPLGAWVCIWGAIAMLTSAPFDNWWHNAYGLDVKIISPPHIVLAVGMIGIVLGAMLLALARRTRRRRADVAGSACFSTIAASICRDDR